MDPSGKLMFLLGDRRGPAPLHIAQDILPAAAAMVNGVNGVGADGGGVSTFGSDTATAAQARQKKRQRIDDLSFDGSRLKAHQNTAPPSPPSRPALPGRRCFVTVGATAGFRSLLEEVSSAGFLQTLAEHGYTLLDVQCGPDQAAFDARVARLRDEDRHGVEVRSFAYTGGMHEYVLACRSERNVRPAGCVISHGGKFSLQSRSWRLDFVATHASSQARERSGRYWASAPH